MTTPYTFRRRTIGRAASPPTWACYEQIHGDEDEDDHDEDDFSDSASDGSDDDEDAGGESGDGEEHRPAGANVEDGVAHDMEMDVDAEAQQRVQTQTAAQAAKGKQRAKQPRSHVYTLRPILTIQRSQGFVWNQDLFVPPYIKDRYVASTSPPNSTGFISTSVSSTNSALTDYEVEVVEIRVQEGEFDGIIP
ncbi:hypothetical protein B0H13DRAFT_2253476 [Mycena leptocephala]|nr:hypothetical protein B0H13DRAFT_2253476 [Mycena leptocephala]